MTIVFALIAAFANALNVITQHVASTAATATAKGWRLALYLVRQPLWLLGVVAMIASFAFQAVALSGGRLSVVQTILVTELVFTLVIGRIWLRREVAVAAWISVSVTCTGLAVFLLVSEPRGGHSSPTPGAWAPALLTMGALTAVLTLLARRGSPIRRAALYATASGIVWAVLATFLKASTDELSAHGLLGMLSHGPVYGVVVTGILGTVLTQAALHYGPLAVSQPLLVTVDPLTSIILGIWLYGERFTRAPLQVTVGVVSFAVMVVGVVFLSRTAPSFESR